LKHFKERLLKMSLPTVELWTDGSVYPNPGGPGGWACLMRYYKSNAGTYQTKTFGGGLFSTTNNRAELTAVLEGIRRILMPCVVHLYSDSEVTVRCLTGKYGKNSNTDLWDELDSVIKEKKHQIVARHMLAHLKAPNDRLRAMAEEYGLNPSEMIQYNAACDSLANQHRIDTLKSISGVVLMEDDETVVCENCKQYHFSKDTTYCEPSKLVYTHRRNVKLKREVDSFHSPGA